MRPSAIDRTAPLVVLLLLPVGRTTLAVVLPVLLIGRTVQAFGHLFRECLTSGSVTQEVWEQDQGQQGKCARQ